VFNQVAELNGWSHAELLAVMGVYTIVGGIIGAFIQPNMVRLIGDVRQGTLGSIQPE
jgi:ABC-2 type transport system permease protein